jgi:general secretion pathway protein A
MGFGAGIDTHAYYPAEAHQSALLKLRYTIENRRAAALLVGPSGCGKTLLVRVLAEQLADELRPVVHVVFPQMPPADLLAYLAAELDTEAAGARTEQATIDSSVRRIQRRLVENANQGRHAVLIIDEGHLLDGGRALEPLRLLLNFETDTGPALTMLLVGQSGLAPMLARNPQFDERLAVKCLLKPLVIEETMAYVQHRLAVAGAERTIFEPAATERLHELSQGIPRQINRLCDLALLVGFAEEHSSIGPEQIDAVSQDLVAVG